MQRPALDWSLRGPGADPDDPNAVAACLDATQRAMQAELDRLRAASPHPVAEGITRLLPVRGLTARFGPTGPAARPGQPCA
ncbi:hypothetical protein ABH931_005120 [Streptacidiphilus sp. MAP12-33]|uniref:hypothetical protein n=1 Tax=Streptacidiphilus sp. MAP12-33 TaxID=3156266 RepID=UPI003512A548